MYKLHSFCGLGYGINLSCVYWQHVQIHRVYHILDAHCKRNAHVRYMDLGFSSQSKGESRN